MKLSNTFLWLDIDGVILNWADIKKYLEKEIIDPLVPGESADFWVIYENLRDEIGQVDIGKALAVLAQKYELDLEKLTSRVKEIDFNSFIYSDFGEFAPELKNFGGYGIFSQGTFWYQNEKYLDLEKLLPVRPKAVLIAGDKTREFDKMRDYSLNLSSLYVDDRRVYLDLALEKKAIDQGVWMTRKPVAKETTQNILVVDNFTDLMKELKEL